MSNNKSPKYTHMTREEFNNIKKLQDAGISISNVSRVTKRSLSTISLIFKADTLEDYKKLVYSKHQPGNRLSLPLASAVAISEAIKRAKAEGGVVLTTCEAIGRGNVQNFIEEASDNDVVVTFMPTGRN